MADRNTLTTANGTPVADNQNTLTASDRGPVLMQDFHLMENWRTSTANAFLSALSMLKEPLHLVHLPLPTTLVVIVGRKSFQKLASKLKFSCGSLPLGAKKGQLMQNVTPEALLLSFTPKRVTGI